MSGSRKLPPSPPGDRHIDRHGAGKQLIHRGKVGAHRRILDEEADHIGVDQRVRQSGERARRQYTPQRKDDARAADRGIGDGPQQPVDTRAEPGSEVCPTAPDRFRPSRRFARKQHERRRNSDQRDQSHRRDTDDREAAELVRRGCIGEQQCAEPDASGEARDQHRRARIAQALEGRVAVGRGPGGDHLVASEHVNPVHAADADHHRTEHERDQVQVDSERAHRAEHPQRRGQTRDQGKQHGPDRTRHEPQRRRSHQHRDRHQDRQVAHHLVIRFRTYVRTARDVKASPRSGLSRQDRLDPAIEVEVDELAVGHRLESDVDSGRARIVGDESLSIERVGEHAVAKLGDPSGAVWDTVH